MKLTKHMVSTVALSLLTISLTSVSAKEKQRIVDTPDNRVEVSKNLVNPLGGSTATAAPKEDIKAADSAEKKRELAKQLANPIAALISVPIQGNYDTNIGEHDSGSKYFVNVEPVVPFSLNEDWNIISRTVLPVVLKQNDIVKVAGVGSGSQTGLGNTVQSIFFSPKKVVDGWTWGAGPVFLLPTATENLLGGDQWGTGATGIVLRQFDDGWTAGILANQIWSFADDKDAKVSNTYLQPFMSFTTPDAWTYALNSESNYNWKSKEWSVPINFMVQHVISVGAQMLALQGGVRYWAVTDSAANAEGWGLRLDVTLMFPKF